MTVKEKHTSLGRCTHKNVKTPGGGAPQNSLPCFLSEDTEVQERPNGCVSCGREELTSLHPTHPLPRSLPPLIFRQVPAFDQVALPLAPPSGPSHEWSSGLRPCQLIGQLPSSDWMLLLRLANPTGYRNRASASTFSLLSLVLR